MESIRLFLTDNTADDVKLTLPIADMPKRRGIKFVAPAEVVVGRYVDEEGLHLRIRTRVTVEFDCYRCCKTSTRSYDADTEEVFPEDDDYLQWSLRDGVDVKEPVFEAIYHTVPEVLLCRDECLGLCPVCGIDKNTAKCSCDRSDTDENDSGNPFAILLNKFGK